MDRPFKTMQPVIVNKHFENKHEYAGTRGYFEGYGPMNDEGSVLVPREGMPKLRLHLVKLQNIQAAPEEK